MKSRVLAAISVFSFTLALIVAGGIETARGQDNLTVEGIWEIVSVSSDTQNKIIGSKVSISRNGDSYVVDSVPPDGNRGPTIYKGNERRIARTNLELVDDPEAVREGNERSAIVQREIQRKFAGQKAPINYSYALSADGNFLTREQDGKLFRWQTNTMTGEVRNIRFEIVPSDYKRTLRRVAGPAKVEPRADRAYQANCGVTDPNRTVPFPPDHEFCPGNLVCMTNFCGGGMGCPYVCCPKGLPHLNHCDCKCYATPDFDCHSRSYCREKLLR